MRRPSPALVISIIALVFAMGGTGWAVTQLPKNSVGTQQIKGNAVTSAKVKNGSLLAADFKAGQLPRGTQGERGAQGPAGDPGSVSGWASRVEATAITVSSAAMVSLGQGSSTSGPITVTRRSRLAITATLTILGRGDGVVQGGVACTLSLTSNGQSVPLDGTDLVALAQVHPSENTYVTFPLANSATVGPGTYDAAINCQKLAGNTISANGRYIRVEALAL